MFNINNHEKNKFLNLFVKMKDNYFMFM